MSETGWVDMYYPDFWDPEAEGEDKPDPMNSEHAGRYSRVTREAFELNWSKKGWVQLGHEDAPAQVGSLQAGGEALPATSDVEEPTPEKSSSSRKTAK